MDAVAMASPAEQFHATRLQRLLFVREISSSRVTRYAVDRNGTPGFQEGQVVEGAKRPFG
jgi:hypothetical protein